MKKPPSKIREEINKLQERLRQAETREAERIGRVALKAGLGEIKINEMELQAAFEDVTRRFRAGKAVTTGGKKPSRNSDGSVQTAPLASGTPQGGSGEA